MGKIMEKEKFIEIENNNIVNENQKKITIFTEDDKEIKCNVVAIFKNEKNASEYIAIVPENETKVYLYGFKNVENVPELNKIESDEEFQIVSDIFNSMLE
ncbi:DUF1292 domain-containing protein [Helicovermis profundi]|uniref:DUF1292 domain-containing protein n=1 Tax=Helicovermis profundi TaxID=3065157 RepID=A0AAU9EBF8_9FIRM|nr:hypothetical protein HLPR_09850 [Clostridia bacterium S502]